MALKAVLIALILCLTFIIISAQDTFEGSGTQDSIVNGSVNGSVNNTCFNSNATCESCTKGKKDCYWCEASKECLEWHHEAHCKGHNYYYGQCQINGAGIIAITVVVIVVIVGLCACCCVCCCCYCMSRMRKRNYEILQENHERTNRSIHSTHNERKAERAARREEIARKYQIGNSKYDQLA